MIRKFTTCATLALVLAGCGVKPPLRYVAPDDSLHDVTFQPRSNVSSEENNARQEPQAAQVRPPTQRSPADVARHHYATAVGLQAACRHDEALAHLRGYLAAEPDGEYAARAMVRMAEIHLDAAYAGRDVERARMLLSEVIARFPDSTSATVARELIGFL